MRIDGHDVRELTLPSLRHHIGMVLDDPFLFSVSIRDNIAYGKPDAAFEDVEAAALAAGADDFIRALPEGYDTVVGERGFTLSGGQRQRLSIARTLLVNPPILVLDDATSAIDVQIEQQIHAALSRLMTGRTTLIIAHRLSTISLADSVAVVEDGRVIAQGTHQELLATEPRYVEILAQTEQDVDAPVGPRQRQRPSGHATATDDCSSTKSPSTWPSRATSTKTSASTSDNRRPTTTGRRGSRLMAWGGGGGGMFGGGGMVGGQMGGGQAGSPGNGLPFAGIPSELQAGVEKLLETEPEWETPDPKFSHRVRESGVTLRSMLGAHRHMLTISIFLVIVEASMLQAGPLLTQIGIDKGITESDWGVLLACAIGSLVCVGLTIVASRFRVSLTGKFSSRIMFELRVRVFAHLQRLSLDYYTDEKAGVIMTRMTSDVEALQQMLQEGLVQFAVQGLTMLVVTVILFFYSVTLALITLVLIVPALTILSLWFRSASDRGYNKVRDGIAGVLSDLSESLSGVRVVVGFNRMRHNVINHRNVVGEYRDANDYTAGITATYGAGSELIGLLGQAALLGIGGTMVQNGTLSVGELVAFLLYLNAFFQPIQQLVQQYNLYQQGQAAITKINELLTTVPSVQEADDAQPLPPINGDLVLTDVSFGYDPAVPGAARRRPPHRGGRDDVVRRRDRRGEVHHRQARHALLRPHRGQRHHRRPRPP